jgi:hypothetical protein
MIKEDIPFSNGKGMHVARIEGQRQGMHCISCALVRRGLEKGEENEKMVL